jgi:hypothetical protein
MHCAIDLLDNRNKESVAACSIIYIMAKSELFQNPMLAASAFLSESYHGCQTVIQQKETPDLRIKKAGIREKNNPGTV